MEGLSGCSTPVLIIKTVTNVRSPGKYKRINEHLDEGGNKNKEKGNTIWMSSYCHQLGTHDKHTCHTKFT
jgi:hypothetical protein